MTRTLTTLAALATLAGCLGDQGLPEQTWITPIDGQSAVDASEVLVVHAGEALVPPDYPLPDLIRVKDLEVDGFVEGLVTVDSDSGDVSFEADQPWAPGHRFVWIFDPVASSPHGPEFEFPPELDRAMAIFDTSDDVHVLGAALDDDDRPCLVFSRKLDEGDDGELLVTANDVVLDDVVFELLPESSWNPYDHPLDIDVACLSTPTPLAEGAVLRVWWGDAGPWRAELSASQIEDTIVELAKGNYAREGV